MSAEKANEKKARSSVFTGGDPSSIGRRSLRYSVGHTREQIERPLVAIVNTWNEVHRGHCHLQRLAAKAKEGVLMARLDNQVYLITDGRFSGYTGGACIGYLSPEAAEGGPLRGVRDFRRHGGHRSIVLTVSKTEKGVATDVAG